MFFRKKQNLRIQTAIALLDRATQIIYNYKWDTKYAPTSDDLKMLARFEASLRESQCIAQYVVRAMHQRFMGEFGSEEEWQSLEEIGFDRKKPVPLEETL